MKIESDGLGAIEYFLAEPCKIAAGDEAARQHEGESATRINDRDMRKLVQARPDMRGWMGNVVLKIGAARDG